MQICSDHKRRPHPLNDHETALPAGRVHFLQDAPQAAKSAEQAIFLLHAEPRHQHLPAARRERFLHGL